MALYRVILPVRHNGGRYMVDDLIELDDGDAADLIARDVVGNEVIEQGEAGVQNPADAQQPVNPAAIALRPNVGGPLKLDQKQLPDAAALAKLNKAKLIEQAALETVPLAADATNKQIVAAILAARGA